MQITANETAPWTLRAGITLEKAELETHLKRAQQMLTQELSVEGFRKGKVPPQVAQQHLKPEEVRAAALELALEESFGAAVAQKQWDVLRTSDLKVDRNDAEGLSYSVTVALWPTVTLADIASVKVARKPIEVSEAEIDEALDTVRNMRATFLDKTGSAAVGDRAEIDFDSFVDGKPVEGGSSRNHPLVIGGKSFMPGFEEELVGLAAGASREFTLTAPADYYEQTLAGKQVQFKVTMHRLQVVLKPAADDAFAASLGKFQNIAQLRDSLREGIANEKQTKEQQRLRLAILDAVIAGSQVPAPDAMVKDELDSMVHRFSHDLQGRGVQLPMYLARLGKTEEQLRTEWQEEAQRQVRIMLVLRAIARQQHIDVPTKELEEAFTATVGEMIRAGQVTEEQIDPERIRVALADRILRDKVLQFVETTCAIA